MNKKIIIIATFVAIISTTTMVWLCTKEKRNKEDNNVETNSNIVNTTDKEEIGEFTEEIIGTLFIEKIELIANIKEGSSEDILKEYIGHIEETAMYDGNVGLAAHNRGNKYSYFARLNELEIGDIVIYKTKYGTREYKVDAIEVILETDWTMLANTSENKITMITCISNRPTQRLCVSATEIKN